MLLFRVLLVFVCMNCMFSQENISFSKEDMDIVQTRTAMYASPTEYVTVCEPYVVSKSVDADGRTIYYRCDKKIMERALVGESAALAIYHNGEEILHIFYGNRGTRVFLSSYDNSQIVVEVEVIAKDFVIVSITDLKTCGEIFFIQRGDCILLSSNEFRRKKHVEQRESEAFNAGLTEMFEASLKK